MAYDDIDETRATSTENRHGDNNHHVEEVIQQIHHEDHDEVIQQIHPDEAAAIVQVQWETTVHQVHTTVAEQDWLAETVRQADSEDNVFVVRVNRRPQGMHIALATSASLNSCRDNLEKAGYDWKLTSGAHVFVHPEQYEVVVRSLATRNLTHSDIVVAESFEYLLEECLQDVGMGAWAKSRTSVSLGTMSTSSCQVTSGTQNVMARVRDEAQALLAVFEVTRTFLCSARPIGNATPVTQSDTNSRMQPGANPRVAVARGID